ncbi:hypothetical protein FOA52_007055 [Chlamydomonas sp. UWO 241]|nr:hypothetical protein FOA52_007055 [Chlamydomonas sp. UWO 241]
MCAAPLASVADSEAARHAHVNACLDACLDAAAERGRGGGTPAEQQQRQQQDSADGPSGQAAGPAGGPCAPGPPQPQQKQQQEQQEQHGQQEQQPASAGYASEAAREAGRAIDAADLSPGDEGGCERAEERAAAGAGAGGAGNSDGSGDVDVELARAWEEEEEEGNGWGAAHSGQPAPPVSGIRAWLESVGMGAWALLFEDAEVDEDTLGFLRDDDLLDMGVGDAADRRAILAHAAAAAAAATGPGAGPSTDERHADGGGRAAAGSGPPREGAVAAQPRAAAPPPAVPIFGGALFNARALDPAAQKITSYFPVRSQQQQQPVASSSGAGAGAGPRPTAGAWMRPGGGVSDGAHHPPAPAPSGGGGAPSWAAGAHDAHGSQAPQQPACGHAVHTMRPIGMRPADADAAVRAAAAGGAAASGSGGGAVALPPFEGDWGGGGCRGDDGGSSAGLSAGGGSGARQAGAPQQAPRVDASGGDAQQQQQQQRHPPGSAPAPQGTGLSRRVPRWQTIPGTRFIVDLFSPNSRDIRGCDYWFLTHFHADHYKGLSRKFDQGTIVCNAVTAQLVSIKLKVPWSRLLVVPMDTPTEIQGTIITLVDANHCPGACMIVAEPPCGVPVLHTGDCRLVPEMQAHPALQKLVGRAVLVLDTTYCDPQYTFPTQKEVLKFTMDAVNTEKFNPRTLFVFGTYTIGKERLFLEVARAQGKKVYVCKDKAAVLACCNLAPEYARLLTTNHLAAQIHAVPLFKVNQDGLSEILDQANGRYTRIVGFAPTGWAHAKTQHKGRCGARVKRGSVITYQVPYSEHSSFAELRDFVAWLKPLEIVPSVGNDFGGPKAKAMLAQLTGPPPRVTQPSIRDVFGPAAGGAAARAGAAGAGAAAAAGTGTAAAATATWRE